VRYCCHANGSATKGLLRAENGDVLNLHHDKLIDAKNTDLLRDIRKAMLKGDRHEGCQRCYVEEDAGIYSRRQSEVELWKNSYSLPQALNQTDSNGGISESDVPLRYLDLRFGNKCNLKCRMCGPTESDQWYQTQTEIWNTTFFAEGNRKLEIVQDTKGSYKLKDNPYNWYDSEDFWKDLDSYMPKMERIYFAGGEPLLIETHLTFLEKCIEKGYASRIELEYNSNITAASEKILKIWSHFKRVDLGISIDGIGAMNEYIRYPSRWSQVHSRIQLVDESDVNLKIWWAATLLVYNFLHFPDLMDWIVDQNFKRINKSVMGSEILSPHMLNNPRFLSIQIFPEASKHKIKDVFAEKKKYFREKTMAASHFSEDEKKRLTKRFDKLIDGYTQLMFKEDHSHMLEKFWKYTNALDKINGTSFRDVSPETYELLSSSLERGLLHHSP